MKDVYEWLDPEDLSNYKAHIADAQSPDENLVPPTATLEAIYQYFNFQQYVCTVLFLRNVTIDSETSLKTEAGYWLVATPDWDSHVFLNAAALYRYLNTIKDRLRYDMYGRVGQRWALQTTASIDVGSFVKGTEEAQLRFEGV